MFKCVKEWESAISVPGANNPNAVESGRNLV